MFFPIGKALKGGWWLVKNLDTILAVWEELKEVRTSAEKSKKAIRGVIDGPTLEEASGMLRSAASTVDELTDVVDKVSPIIDELQKRIIPKKKQPKG